MTSSSAKTIETIRALREDHETFCRKCLRVKTKSGDIVPLVLNDAQVRLHERLEAQKRKTGKVRAILVKGRQMGASTYIASRFYRRATLWRGQSVYILAHEQKASDNLFDMVRRFHQYNPLAPATGDDNAKLMEFPMIGGQYRVGTAGAKESGRGQTFNLFHFSEVAFVENAAAHFAASVQAVSDAPGTEIILESTANGYTNEFAERYFDAAEGNSPYEAIFLPWYLDKGYTMTPPDGFELSNEPPDGYEDEPSEIEYAEMHGLSVGQMAWRRSKLAEIRDYDRFCAEYPATADEAFRAASAGAYIRPKFVADAQARVTTPAGEKIAGIDPSGEGEDSFVFLIRHGHVVTCVEKRKRMAAPEALEWIRALLAEHRPDKAYMDAGGLGATLLQMLHADPSLRGLVEGVNFGGKSQAKHGRPNVPGPKNRRAEMYQRMKFWLTSDPCFATLPKNKELARGISSVRAKMLPSGDFILESKKDMRSRGEASPDEADALALTFADDRVIQTGSYAPASDRSEATEGPMGYTQTWHSPNSWMG